MGLPADSTGRNGQPPTLLARLLTLIEWAGNKLPDPAMLFLLAMAATWVISALLAGVDFPEINPRSTSDEHRRITDQMTQTAPQLGTALAGLSSTPLGNGSVSSLTAYAALALPRKEPETIRIRNQLTAEAQVTFLTRMVDNFTGFKPLGLVLVAMLGVGVAEHTGFINALVKALLSITPRKLLTPMLLVVAIISHTAGDTGFVLVIPLGGLIFAAAGRHPLAGIACAFAGVAGGFSANFIPSGLDPLLQSFTQTAAQIVEPSRQVNPLCNWLFMSASCVVIVLVGWYLTDRVIEPRIASVPVDGDATESQALQQLSATERRGLYAGLFTFVLGLVLLVLACWPTDSPFRAHGTDPARDRSLSDFSAPLMKSIVPLIFLLFLFPGIVHGYVAGTVKNSRDIVRGMTKSMGTMSYYLVMAFFAAQFIYAFEESNLAVLLAMKGTNFLKGLGLPPQVTILGIILLTTIVNMLIGSASAKWALLSPIFVPMLMPLGISPELIQAAYRIADSSTHLVTPLLPYFPLVLLYAQRHAKSVGAGTLISLMVPYTVWYLIAWTSLLMVFWHFHLPLGIPTDVAYYP